MDKNELRRAMKRRNRSLTPEERATASKRIFDRIEQLPAFGEAKCVACFRSLPDEPDTAEALQRWSAGRRVVIPRVEGDTMHFYDYDPATLRPGAFGIDEPGPDARRCDPAEIDLIVVPGTAFTPGGIRMGRGRGYYDKYLAQPEVHAFAAGACYAHQLVANLPAEPHDMPAACVCTDLMTPAEFTAACSEAFGPKAGLPLVFWYSDEAVHPAAKIEGCLFKGLAAVREGSVASLNAGNIGCGGGRFYTGFAPMPEYVPTFVSAREHYKRTAELVCSFVGRLDVQPARGAWLHFARVDRIDRFEGKEALLFFAEPDVLAGLVSWASFDGDTDDAVAAPFGSGCSATVSQAVRENRIGGRRCFLGLFDPSVRPWVGRNETGFVIPMQRFYEMCGTMRASSLFGTRAWSRVRERIDGQAEPTTR